MTHKLRIVNPARDSGSTMGTEVWLDDQQLQSVTRIEFLAEVDSLYHVRIDLNVRLDEVNLYASPELRVSNQDRERLDAIREAWQKPDFQSDEWIARLRDLIAPKSAL